MFEVGFTEILLILGIGLLVLGPEKLPKVAAQVGRWAGRARAMARNLKDQLDEEVHRAEQGLSPNLDETPARPAPGNVAAAASAITAAGAATTAAAATPPAAPPAAPPADDVSAELEADDPANFAHREDPFLRDGDPPEPPPAAAEPAPAAPGAEATPTPQDAGPRP